MSSQIHCYKNENFGAIIIDSVKVEDVSEVQRDAWKIGSCTTWMDNVIRFTVREQNVEHLRDGSGFASVLQ